MTWEWLCLLTGSVAVSVGCLLPARWVPPLPNDKLLHFLAFGALTLLTERVAQGWWQLAAGCGLLLAGGGLIELLQNLVPGRQFCWRDLAANAAGIATAAACAPLLLRF